MSPGDFTTHLVRGHEVLRIEPDGDRFTYRDASGKRRTDRFIDATVVRIDGVKHLVLLVDPAPYGVDLAGVINMDGSAEELAKAKR